MISFHFWTRRNHRKHFLFYLRFSPLNINVIREFHSGIRTQKSNRDKVITESQSPFQKKRESYITRREGLCPWLRGWRRGLQTFRTETSKISSFTGLGRSAGQASIFTTKATHLKNPKQSLDSEVLICLTSWPSLLVLNCS